MKRKHFVLDIILLFLLLFCAFGWAQSPKILTFEEAISIALNKSYKVKSSLEQKTAMQQNFNYSKARFKPQLDIYIDTPRWSENVSAVLLPDGLPVYNSNGSMQIGGNLKFTYTLPTGGYFALSSKMYRDNVTMTLAQQDYIRLREDKAFSNLRLSFTQPIFTANMLREGLKEAEYKYERSSSYFTQSQMDIIYQVTDRFYALYRATKVVEIDQEQLKNSEESYRITKLKAESGRISEGDVLSSEVDVAKNRADLSESIGSLEREKDLFKQLIGIDLDEEFQILTDLQYDTFSIDLEKAMEEALKNRLELQIAELEIELQKIALDRAGRERELRGDITASYDMTGFSSIGTGTTRDLFQSSFDDFLNRPPNRSITFTLSYPIFDWGRGSARVQQEEANLRSKELDRENIETTIICDVRDIVRSVEEAKNRLKIREKNQEVAQRSYAISRLRFENGEFTSQDLGVEQEKLAGTQLDYLDAFITYQRKIADLKKKTMWDFKNNRSYLMDDYFQEEE